MQSIDLLQNDVRILGASGSKSPFEGTCSLQVAYNIVIDAGNIIQGLQEQAAFVEHIFLTHAHLDHIVDIAFLVENYFDTFKTPLKIYALPQTIESLKEHFLNDRIWPDFSKIALPNSNQKAIEYIPLTLNKKYDFPNVSIRPIEVEHTIPTCAYVIEKKFFSLIYAPDTHICENIWKEINQNPKIDSLLIDLSFPSRLESLAKVSKHLSPSLLEKEINKLDHSLSIYAIHLKKNYQEEIIQEVENSSSLKKKIRFLPSGAYLKKGLLQKEHNNDELEMLTALSKENDLDKMLERILVQVMQYTNSEGGTIYLKEQNQLKFKVVINKKLGIHNNNISDWPPIELYTPKGSNLSNVSALCANKNEIINIADVYNAEGFDFEGMKKFDKANNYRSKSMLVIPMVDHENDLIGVLQLINKKDPIDYEYIPFEKSDIKTSLSYSAYCAIAITKNRLIEDLEKLLLSFLESIAVAMDAKSPYGYGHINRVAKLAEMISQKINEDQSIFKEIHYNKDALQEIKLAAWMHDIGKIATPESILDKSTKLETIYNRIYEISERFRSVSLSLRLHLAEAKIAHLQGDTTINIKKLEKETQQTLKTLYEDLIFIKRKNLPSGFMNDEDVAKIQKIAQKHYHIDNEEVALLKEDEAKNLCIRYGTLNKEERDIINKHAQISIDMLDMLVFPKKYAHVPLIAGMHHEKLNGKGYPKGVSAEKIPFEARLLAIADIFEALTAHDRPYKKPKTLKESYEILDQMVQNGEIDADIVHFLKESGLFYEYGKKYLRKEQLIEA